MAFTTTKDLPLAATTTGSWPRPSWYTQSLWGRPLDTAMLDPTYREGFSDALAVVIPEAQRAPSGICIRRREMMLGLEPTVPIAGKRIKGPPFNHHCLP